MANEFPAKYHDEPQTSQSDKLHPLAQYEYVDVTFKVADTDTPITYKVLKPQRIDEVRFLDVNPGEGRVYRSRTSQIQWTSRTIVLRSTASDYTTRLLLFIERD